MAALAHRLWLTALLVVEWELEVVPVAVWVASPVLAVTRFLLLEALVDRVNLVQVDLVEQPPTNMQAVAQMAELELAEAVVEQTHLIPTWGMPQEVAMVGRVMFWWSSTIPIPWC